MPFPIMVLEGPDNGGKSTLAKGLAKHLNGVVLHSTYRFKGHMMAYHLAQFRKALRLANKQPVIMDRWWPSEVAYGNTFRMGPESNFDKQLLIDLGKAYYVSYTYCMPTGWDTYWRWSKSVWKQEDEMYEPDEAKYNWLWDNYRTLMLYNYNYYPLNLTQYYDVTREYARDDGVLSFCKYILARLKSQIAILEPENKELMKRMAYHWKLVGRLSLDQLPEVPQEPALPPPPKPVLTVPYKPSDIPTQGSLF
jgi:hypothetical protein